MVERRARRVVGVAHGNNVQAVCNVTNQRKETKESERLKPKVKKEKKKKKVFH